MIFARAVLCQTPRTFLTLDIINKINQTTQSILTNPSFKVQFEKQGFRVIGGTQAEFSKFYFAEIERYGRVVKEANLKSGD